MMCMQTLLSSMGSEFVDAWSALRELHSIAGSLQAAARQKASVCCTCAMLCKAKQAVKYAAMPAGCPELAWARHTG
jgi:hypothetical protein